MANTFTRKVSRGIGTALTAVGSYVVGASTQTTVIGLTVANTSAATVNIDVTVNDGANDIIVTGFEIEYDVPYNHPATPTVLPTRSSSRVKTMTAERPTMRKTPREISGWKS